MNVQGIDATYYYAQDLARATTFYTELLGMEPVGHHPGMYSEWVFPGGEAFGLYESDDFRTSEGVMFAVADVAAAVAECSARGVEFGMAGHVEETPACFMAFGKDSEGNGFILHHRK